MLVYVKSIMGDMGSILVKLDSVRSCLIAKLKLSIIRSAICQTQVWNPSDFEFLYEQRGEWRTYSDFAENFEYQYFPDIINWEEIEGKRMVFVTVMINTADATKTSLYATIEERFSVEIADRIAEGIGDLVVRDLDCWKLDRFCYEVNSNGAIPGLGMCIVDWCTLWRAQTRTLQLHCTTTGIAKRFGSREELMHHVMEILNEQIANHLKKNQRGRYMEVLRWFRWGFPIQYMTSEPRLGMIYPDSEEESSDEEMDPEVLEWCWRRGLDVSDPCVWP